MVIRGYHLGLERTIFYFQISRLSGSVVLYFFSHLLRKHPNQYFLGRSNRISAFSLFYSISFVFSAIFYEFYYVTLQRTDFLTGMISLGWRVNSNSCPDHQLVIPIRKSFTETIISFGHFSSDTVSDMKRRKSNLTVDVISKSLFLLMCHFSRITLLYISLSKCVNNYRRILQS